MSTLKDIAECTGLSISTVSYALNGKGSISESTVRLVTEAAIRLKYDPNSIARRLKTGVSNLIGVIVNLDNLVNYSNRILNNLNTLSSRHGYRLIVVHSGDFTQDVRFMKDNKVDGIVYLATNYINSDIFHSLKKLECTIPMVFINCFHREFSDSCVLYDEEKAIFDIATYLAGNKHRNIGCITGEKNWQATRLRLRGFKRAIEGQGLKNNLTNIRYGSYFLHYQSIVEDKVKELVDAGVTAIVCFNDVIASTAYKVATHKGIKIPDQLSITGFDDLLFASLISPTLTSVEIPVDGLARSAFSLLLSKIQKTPVDEQMRIPCEIRLRESVARLS